MQIQVVRPSMLKQKEEWAGWPRLPVDARLQQLVAAAPMRTQTSNKTLSDPTNLMFLGAREQLMAAFGEAGWYAPDDLGVESALKTAQATLRQTGYNTGPVSTLLVAGRPPDLVFQKSLDTFPCATTCASGSSTKPTTGRKCGWAPPRTTLTLRTAGRFEMVASYRPPRGS
jgi:LssY C-terminus